MIISPLEKVWLADIAGGLEIPTMISPLETWARGDSVPTWDSPTPEGAGRALPVCGRGITLSTMVSFDLLPVDEAERLVSEASVPVRVVELMISPDNVALANEAVALSDEKAVINLPISEDEPPSVKERFDWP